MRKVTIFGTEFSLGFGEVITKGDINKLTVSFNTGNLEWDSIRIWIANENETTAQIQYDEDYTDMYTDKTIELAGLFTEKYSETGLYVMNIRLRKGTRFLDAENVLFEYSNYEPSEMGINLPADIAFAFAPCVVSYDDSTLYTSEDTKVAKYMSVTVNGYTETREVYKGKVAIDIQQYLRTVFEGVDLWNLSETCAPMQYNGEFEVINQIKQQASILVRLMDKDGNTIGRASKVLNVFFGVGAWFDIPGARFRNYYYNLPFTLDFASNSFGINYEFRTQNGFAGGSIGNDNAELLSDYSSIFVRQIIGEDNNHDKYIDFYKERYYDSLGEYNDGWRNKHAASFVNVHPIGCTEGVYLRWNRK